MPSIVVTNVFQTSAPAPITLQQTGGVISQGATTLANNSKALLTQASDLSPLLAVSLAIASLAWSSGTVLATTAATIPGLTTGDKFRTTIAGATPVGYNGLVLATVTGANTFTYALAANPGAETGPGAYTPPSQAALVAAINTYFAEGGSTQAVYILELGTGDGTSGPPLLNTWIQNNPATIYAFLVPREWDATAAFTALLAQYQAPNAGVYFFATTTVANYPTYTALQKCLFALIDAPGTPLTEFSCAAPFEHALSYNPSASNRMTQFAFSPLFGVTPYPTPGNGPLLTTLKNANINYVGTGAEGGISNAILFWGRMLDGNDYSYWFAADWYRLNGDQALANAVINGSATGANPLSYDQSGVNRLQDVLVQVTQTGVSFNLFNGTVGRAALDGPEFQANLNDGDYTDTNIVNAVPFIIYTTENPGNYKAGIYGGLTGVVLIQRGFVEIVFNINLTSFVNQ